MSAPPINPVQTNENFPATTKVVIIGGGIVGLVAALTLAERNIPVVLLEKGHLAGEQSSRNLGWIRKMGRAALDVPLAVASDQLWQQMPARTGQEVGYKQAGIMYICRTEAEMAMHENWLRSVNHLELDSKLLSAAQINTLVPGGIAKWLGGIFTASDGRAEPTLAASAIARAAIKHKATVVENCAVRGLALTAGKISGVITERGEIRCEQVLLAGGMWSRRFLNNHAIALPTLPLICSVLNTAPMEGPTEIAVGAPDFSFRKRFDGGFTITQRGALEAPLTVDHALIGQRYLATLKQQRQHLRVSLGTYFLRDLLLLRHWNPKRISPFERVRTLEPLANLKLNAEAMRNLIASWPVFKQANIARTWAGVIDVTPDSTPVIDRSNQIPGLTIATGFSGHGFGTAPAAGQLAADLISNHPPIVDPAPYKLERFN